MLLSKRFTVTSLMTIVLAGASLAITAKPVSASSYGSGTGLSQEDVEASTEMKHHVFTEAEVNNISNLIEVKNNKYLVNPNKVSQASQKQIKLAEQFVNQVNETENNLRLYGVYLAHPHHKTIRIKILVGELDIIFQLMLL